MGDSHKFITLAVLSYTILIAMFVFQVCYINKQHQTIFELRKRIIDLESPSKVDSIFESLQDSKKEDVWKELH